MDVKAFIEWLQTLPQDAIVQVIHHSNGTGYYDQGGNIDIRDFTPAPATEENKWTEYFELYRDRNGNATLLLGSTGN
ncbi:TPA: hypothetical protein QCJ60_000002 [Enterobacter sichuanensis]|jgi:hypothetical protein|nr:hypothetical protein [Escherichia coli]HDR2780770.1 hypothetical protein [Enterobacter sichuanensis]